MFELGSANVRETVSKPIRGKVPNGKFKRPTIHFVEEQVIHDGQRQRRRWTERKLMGLEEQLCRNWIIIRYRLNKATVLLGERETQPARNYKRGMNAKLKCNKKRRVWPREKLILQSNNRLINASYFDTSVSAISSRFYHRYAYKIQNVLQLKCTYSEIHSVEAVTFVMTLF